MAVWQIPQLRPRFVLVAIREPWAARFRRPGAIQAAADDGSRRAARPHELARMTGTQAWSDSAGGIAPTIVGGSKKHGGPDLGLAFKPLAVRYWARTMRSPAGELCFAAHTRHAEPEMLALANQVTARLAG